MSPYDALEQRATNALSLQESAEVLSDLLTGGFAVWEDGSLYSIKQLVARVRGLEIRVYPNEHAPAHFHVVSPDIDASFTIEDCAFIRGNIDGREQRLVRWWYSRSREKLIQAWNETRPSDCPVGPIGNDAV